MSTFGGRFREIDSISADRFDGINLSSKVFFLSHCHTDHMLGLDNHGLPGPLYLSAVSAVIIRRQYPKIKLVAMKTGGIHEKSFRIQLTDLNQEIVPIEPTLVNFHDNSGISRRITVTTIPAAHCPGSVMFLFEEKNLKILYTGDFRLRLKELNKIIALKDRTTGACLAIDSVYIDSTFFKKIYKLFPTQHESTAIVCTLIEQWLQRSPSHKVSLRTCARYGYESLFKCIYDRFRLPIHVNHSELLTYQYVPELDDCFTSDGSVSRIHTCFSTTNRNSLQLCCDPSHDTKKILVIRPSAMIWTKWQPNQAIFEGELDKQIVRVCYSNHASYTEVRDLLLYLRPKSIELNVVPTCTAAKAEMNKEIKDILAEYQTVRFDDSANNELATLNSQISFSNIFKRQRTIQPVFASSGCSISDEDDDIMLTKTCNQKEL